MTNGILKQGYQSPDRSQSWVWQICNPGGGATGLRLQPCLSNKIYKRRPLACQAISRQKAGEPIPGIANPQGRMVKSHLQEKEGKMDKKKKIQLLPSMKAIATRLRAQGKKIVFTNGCFDILHVGHVRYLRKAKGLGDTLVVGLNTDRSVKRIKGQKRPIVPEKERAEVLSALECVDYIVFFDEPDPLRLIEALRPDRLVKGADWAKSKIVGRETVERYGGRVVRIPLVPGASSSGVIEKIVKIYSRG